MKHQLRRYLWPPAAALMLLLALPGAVGWLLRDIAGDRLQTDNTLTGDIRGGFLSSRLVMQYHAGRADALVAEATIRHGPLLFAPLSAGWFAAEGAVLDAAGHNDALHFNLHTSLTGRLRLLGEIPERMDLGHAAGPRWNAPRGEWTAMLDAGGELLLRVRHPGGGLCLAEFSLSWHGLGIQGRLADTRDWLQDGELSIESEQLLHFPGNRCSATGAAPALRVETLEATLDWPPGRPIRINAGLGEWRTTAGRAGPALLALRAEQIDREQLSAWLQLLADHSRREQTTALDDIALAGQTASLLAGRPRLIVEQLSIDSAAGDFRLHGTVQLRAGGFSADINGHTTAQAAQTIAAALLGDADLAAAQLAGWRRLGILQQRGDRWLIDLKINR